MSARTWLGGIYLRKRGHGIVLRALDHYRRRVANVGSDPQIRDVPSLRMLIAEEGKKTAEKVPLVIKIINAGLDNPKLIEQVEFEVSLIEKALNCYKSDIEKIVNTMVERYTYLFDEPKNLQSDLPLIKEALVKIKQFG